MTHRDTQWDEEDTTSSQPLLPGELGSAIKSSEAMDLYIRRIYSEGVSEEIVSMCEDRIEINKIIDRVPPVRQEGEALIIPVVVEKMVLVKKTILVEEIVLSPQTVDEQGKLKC